MNDQLKKGVYKHYKGNFYLLEDVALHSETEEAFAIYRPMYGERALWIRPLSMFIESVELNGKKVPRFAYFCSEEEFSASK